MPLAEEVSALKNIYGDIILLQYPLKITRLDDFLEEVVYAFNVDVIVPIFYRSIVRELVWRVKGKNIDVLLPKVVTVKTSNRFLKPFVDFNPDMEYVKYDGSLRFVKRFVGFIKVTDPSEVPDEYGGDEE